MWDWIDPKLRRFDDICPRLERLENRHGLRHTRRGLLRKFKLINLIKYYTD